MVRRGEWDREAEAGLAAFLSFSMEPSGRSLLMGRTEKPAGRGPGDSQGRTFLSALGPQLPLPQ